jgi:hypothetical protein
LVVDVKVSLKRGSVAVVCMKERGSGEGTVSELLARGVLKLEYRNL